MDFSHHRNLCNKHNMLNFTKTIQYWNWSLDSAPVEHSNVCECKPRRNSSLGWWKVPDGKVSSLTSAQEPSAQDHTEHVQWAPAPAGLMSNAKKHFLPLSDFFHPQWIHLQWIQSTFVGNRGLVYDGQHGLFSAIPGKCPTQEHCSHKCS